MPFGRPIGRRFQTVDAATTPKQSAFQRLWNSPIGVKTVHFWAPVMKWALVLAGIGDFYRPAEKLSLTQNVALTCTGAIWTRWCLIIKPKNYLLAAVNFFLGCVGTVQVGRILFYRRSVKGSTVAEEVNGTTEETIDGAKGADKSVAVARNATE
ncbi:MAG: Mitochondrial pyruvate carrier 2 [Trichoglossum hirsutum]|nr:MAG: Mitochondrial pyruvate carrier 2 [Trichoglossum hirsutum]